MRNRKRVGLLGTLVASLGSLISPGCYGNRVGILDEVDILAGRVGVALGAICMGFAYRQETQGDRDTMTGIGATLFVLGGSVLVIDYAYSSPRYGLNEKYEGLNEKIASDYFRDIKKVDEGYYPFVKF